MSTKRRAAVPDMTRLELLLLITEFHLSCYLAARILGLRYAYAKRIY